mmetsp:Transcript_12990/g.22295  ORF Transcript_12990/g.22295 Transcript_12990/m.22295 type:complete len:85 (+) Transcript_12990:1923-2177(+)
MPIQVRSPINSLWMTYQKKLLRKSMNGQSLTLNILAMKSEIQRKQNMTSPSDERVALRFLSPLRHIHNKIESKSKILRNNDVNK